MVVGQRVDGVRGGAHAGVGRICQQLGHGVGQGGVHQRLIALHVDHNRVVRQAQNVAGLGQAVAAAGVVGAGQHRFNAVRLAGSNDLGAVACHYHAGHGEWLLAHLSGSAHLRVPAWVGVGVRARAHVHALRYPHNHGQASNIGQRLVGQPRGG